jgi:hypothetical protein
MVRAEYFVQDGHSFAVLHKLTAGWSPLAILCM